MRNKIALYARVSTSNNGQDPETQFVLLREYAKVRGFEIYKEFVDTGVSGTKDSRPSLNQLMDDARKRKFDSVLVFRFDRFARSSRHLIQALEEFRGLGIDFISYSENIDTTSPLGKAIFVIIGAMAELERNIIVERVKCGLKAAKAKGKRLGRPQVTLNIERLFYLKNEGKSIRQIAMTLGLSKSTIGKYLSDSNKVGGNEINPV
jgi:DNA invertase Pin-like site-specific DNA recombinase